MPHCLSPNTVKMATLVALNLLSPTWAQDQKAEDNSNGAADRTRPNILWIFAEDTSPWMGCYGDRINQGETPHIDSLAQRGVRFSRAFVPAPVCSACRSAMMVGQNSIRFGAHQHRSSRSETKLQLPPGIKLLPQMLQEAGYFTFNCGKSDYNFVWDEAATYSFENKSRQGVPWQRLKEQQPFFGQIQTAGGKNNTSRFPKSRKADPSKVTVPADYPDNEIYKTTVAQHYDAIRMDDDFIGTVLEQLSVNGLDANTIVVYFSDHGANNLVRHKQMPTEGGLHVPFIVAGPDPWVPAPSVRDDLVNMLDLSATTLVWAGLKIPEYFEGQDLFGIKVIPRSYVAAAKDRLDHTIDRVRSVRSSRFRFTRNYKLDRVLLQPQYRDRKDYLINLRELYANGELPEALAKIYFGERPAEELYDVVADPSQLTNLVDNPNYADELQLHRGYLDQWLAKGDLGSEPESVGELTFQAKPHKWGTGVNPEYEAVRVDSDGDGLSDEWETANSRNPKDGRILFTFDCGGWQTEGWKTVAGSPGNIAGRQGFLDFGLGEGKVVLRRKGLQAPASQNKGSLAMSVRTSGYVVFSAQITAGGVKQKIDDAEICFSGGFNTVRMPLPELDGNIESLELEFEGSPDLQVEIDRIAIE
ncbi:MAG: sulfatase-like hydrolase/transferase [Aureliella sp.]